MNTLMSSFGSVTSPWTFGKRYTVIHTISTYEVYACVHHTTVNQLHNRVEPVALGGNRVSVLYLEAEPGLEVS